MPAPRSTFQISVRRQFSDLVAPRAAARSPSLRKTTFTAHKR
jgi:hypothetical protein